MERRTALKMVTLEVLASAAHCASAEEELREPAWTPGNCQLHFFTEPENDMLDQLIN